jgi:hypothetical protein
MLPVPSMTKSTSLRTVPSGVRCMPSMAEPKIPTAFAPNRALSSVCSPAQGESAKVLACVAAAARGSRCSQIVALGSMP